MDGALNRKIADYADKAYAATYHTSTQQTALKIAESKARLASRGLILSGNTVYEVARLQGEHINTVVQAKAEALLDAYELYGADIDDSILEAATTLRATLLDSISAYPASGLPPGVPAFEQFRLLLETNTGAILNTIACQIEQRRVIPKLRTTSHDRSFEEMAIQEARQNLPNKEVLLSNLQTVFERHSVSAILVIDLDHFKIVNDTKGHSEGDACLDCVVRTIATVVGRKGKLYRWGGDEFAVLLPDFSTEEAQVTAERIRYAVEQAKPGGEIAVTTSIGICGTDRTDSKSAEEILDFADKAMYESKRLGKNRVTKWPFAAAKA